MLGLKSFSAKTNEDDDNNWHFMKYDNDTIRFPHLNFNSDTESIELPSPILSDRFTNILNHGKLDGDNELKDFPKLSFREKSIPDTQFISQQKLSDDDIVVSSTPVNNSPIQEPQSSDKIIPISTSTEPPLHQDLMALIKIQTDQISQYQCQLKEQQSIIDELKQENERMKRVQADNEGELNFQKKTNEKLRDELHLLERNYTSDREHWNKVLKSHEWEMDESNKKLETWSQSNKDLSTKVQTLTDENHLLKIENGKLKTSVSDQDALTIERDSIIDKIDTITRERLEWFEKYEKLKDRYDELEKKYKDTKPPTYKTKPLTESQFGLRYSQLNMQRVDSLDPVALQNVIKNILASLNISYENLKDYILFIRDDYLDFFKRIHQIIHQSGLYGDIDTSNREKLKLCMNILVDDIKTLRNLC